METIIMVRVGFMKHWEKNSKHHCCDVSKDEIQLHFLLFKKIDLYILETYLILFFSFGQIMRKIIMVNVGICETFGRNTIEIQ
jgi:hypothetical protein